MSKRLTHLDETGTARMVNVGAKSATERMARAGGIIRMSTEALAAIKAGDAPKGDVLGTARIAAIVAAKKTGELIPLCHPLSLDAVDIDFAFEDDGVGVTATASLTGRTGVEMEALTGASVAALTVYDMCKALSHDIVISETRLLSKTGGKQDYSRDTA